MALFSRGKNTSGGEASRERGAHRGRGRGRGRGNLKSRFTKHSPFATTRLEEPAEEFSGDGAEVEGGDKKIHDTLESSSEEEEQTYIAIRPYNALLQTLNTDAIGSQPQRKKHKLNNQKIRNLSASSAEANPYPAFKNVKRDVDHVEEPEEGGIVVIADSEVSDDTEEAEGTQDAFDTHYANPDEKKLLEGIRDAREGNWSTRTITFEAVWKTVTITLGSNAMLPWSSNYIPKSIKDLELKYKLKGPAERDILHPTSFDRHLASVIFSYRDLFFYDRTPQKAEKLRKLACLHAINHVLKTRDKIIKNNSRLARGNICDDLEFRDQGFTRPKVLMLLPTRQACVKAIDTIVSFCEPEQQENKKRFLESYAGAAVSFSDDKPQDFRELFEGNDDDMFRIGMKFTRKNVKYFSQFYNSDIIFASPLGLRMAIGSEDAKKQDYDFLSSIEILLIDQADALLMQNWEHVGYIFDHLNLQPKEAHGCDFSRVRNWYLDGNSKYLRQTLVFSGFNTPELNRVFGHNMTNLSGKFKFGKEKYHGSMLGLGTQIKQTFSRFDAATPLLDPDTRFKVFISTIVPALSRNSKAASGRGQGVLIYIPSYLDFVRIRNYLATASNTQSISFGSISEYTSARDVARARSHFFSGRHSVLLYTGRAHHFRRYRLRGVRKVIMYALPDNPIFYTEVAGDYLVASISEGMVDSGEVSARSLFSKWDMLKLERIVGTERSAAMLKEKGGDTFNFL